MFLSVRGFFQKKATTQACLTQSHEGTKKALDLGFKPKMDFLYFFVRFVPSCENLVLRS